MTILGLVELDFNFYSAWSDCVSCQQIKDVVHILLKKKLRRSVILVKRERSIMSQLRRSGTFLYILSPFCIAPTELMIDDLLFITEVLLLRSKGKIILVMSLSEGFR